MPSIPEQRARNRYRAELEKGNEPPPPRTEAYRALLEEVRAEVEKGKMEVRTEIANGRKAVQVAAGKAAQHIEAVAEAEKKKITEHAAAAFQKAMRKAVKRARGQDVKEANATSSEAFTATSATVSAPGSAVLRPPAQAQDAQLTAPFQPGSEELPGQDAEAAQVMKKAKKTVAAGLPALASSHEAPQEKNEVFASESLGSEHLSVGLPDAGTLPVELPAARTSTTLPPTTAGNTQAVAVGPHESQEATPECPGAPPNADAEVESAPEATHPPAAVPEESATQGTEAPEVSDSPNVERLPTHEAAEDVPPACSTLALATPPCDWRAAVARWGWAPERWPNLGWYCQAMDARKAEMDAERAAEHSRRNQQARRALDALCLMENRADTFTGEIPGWFVLEIDRFYSGDPKFRDVELRKTFGADAARAAFQAHHEREQHEREQREAQMRQQKAEEEAKQARHNAECDVIQELHEACSTCTRCKLRKTTACERRCLDHEQQFQTRVQQRLTAYA